MSTGDARTKASLLAVGVANTTCSARRRPWRRRSRIRVSLAGLVLSALAALAFYLLT